MYLCAYCTRAFGYDNYLSEANFGYINYKIKLVLLLFII